jgi:hypothetical protein
VGREHSTTLVLDEVRTSISFRHYHLLINSQFYSWYIYHDDEKDFGKPVSSAAYIDDVNDVFDSR